jgi:hypothetical protein
VTESVHSAGGESSGGMLLEGRQIGSDDLLQAGNTGFHRREGCRTATQTTASEDAQLFWHKHVLRDWLPVRIRAEF